MTEDKWLDLLDDLKEKFDIDRHTEEQITEDDMGNKIINNIEIVTFQSDLGSFKLVKTTRPTILDKKVHYSHTSGTKGLVEYILSPTEKTTKVQLFRLLNNDWQELDMSVGEMKF